MQVDGSVVTEGNTVQEAVEKGLRMLQITRQQAKIEIIDGGKQGFLGLGSKLAKVRVSLKEEAKTEMELTDLLIDLDIKDEARQEQYMPKITDNKAGVAEVREGQLVITNPKDLGKYATIKPGKNVRIFFNGQEVKEEIPVSETDEVRIELVDDEPVLSFELTVAEDKLAAYLKLVYRPGAKYKLKDQPQTNSLMVLAEVAEMIELPPATPESVHKYLEEQNVVKGILDEGIQQVLANPNGKENILVARGQAPVDGVSAYVRFPFQEKKQDMPEEGLFGRHTLVSVTPGEVLALKVPKQLGQDGWAVTGETLPAKIPADCELAMKTGCEMADNGNKVIAVIAGRPGFENLAGKTLVFVDPIYEVKDVDAKTGDIKFAGDVQIRGSVRDGFKVEADGNIEVFGDVTRATIKAGASVTIHKMALGSTIIAGGRAAMYASIYPALNGILETLVKVRIVAQQLHNAPGFKTTDLQTNGDGPLIQLLLDSKFNTLPKSVAELYNAVFSSGLTVHEEVTNAVQILYKHLCGLGPTNIASLEYLQALENYVKQIIDLIKSFNTKEDCIKVRYVQNCSLLSSGDVIVEGQGCYISSITSGGEVIVAGNPGIARGVKIVANGDIIIKELGSEFDTQTLARVKGNGKVTAELIHPNVVVQIGNDKCRVDNLYKSFKAYINHEGRLMVDNLTAE